MIYLRKGDCLKHERPCCIVHCCNDIGAWGAGFVMSISRVNRNAELQYRKWFENGNPKLGDIQLCELVPDKPSKMIVNLIGQTGVGTKFGIPVRYWAISQGLQTVKNCLKGSFVKDVVSPLIGCGLAGGSLEEIFGLVYNIYSDRYSPDYYFYAYTDEDYTKLVEVAAKFGISV